MRCYLLAFFDEQKVIVNCALIFVIETNSLPNLGGNQSYHLASVGKSYFFKPAVLNQTSLSYHLVQKNRTRHRNVQGLNFPQ
jgi:hypothetical protein